MDPPRQGVNMLIYSAVGQKDWNKMAAKDGLYNKTLTFGSNKTILPLIKTKSK